MDCANHPGTPANSYCQICGKALCPLCTVRDQGIVLCSNCVERTTAEDHTGWTAVTNHSQRMIRPASQLLICGYISAVTALAVYLMVTVFNSFALPYLGWTFEEYSTFSMIRAWTVSFPLSLLLALGYWGFRVKYNEPFLAATALATAVRMPVVWAAGLIPLSWTLETYVMYSMGLEVLVAVLTIWGLLLIRSRCEKPSLDGAIVILLILALVWDIVRTYGFYYTDFWLDLAVVLSGASLALTVVSGLAFVLFFRAELRASSID